MAGLALILRLRISEQPGVGAIKDNEVAVAHPASAGGDRQAGAMVVRLDADARMRLASFMQPEGPPRSRRGEKA
jgi:hypothetical protein